jgi:thiamine-phosphate pyrophosphorylase
VRFGDRRLYLCTPDRPDLAGFVAACISGGVDVVQLRDKHLEARALVARARVVRDVCRDRGVPFVLNDRPDLALEVGADGVHVGQEDAPAVLARRILGPDRIIGLSTHHPSELSDATAEPVDYVSAGPIVATPTKPGRLGTGIEYVHYVARIARAWPGRDEPMPFYVTGGVTPQVVRTIARAGGRRFVVVRYLTESDNPLAAAHRLRSAIDEALDEVSEV